MEHNKYLNRYCPPTKLDIAPHGTLCKVLNETGTDYELYVQVGDDEQAPDWQRLGIILEQAFKDFASYEEIKKIIFAHDNK